MLSALTHARRNTDRSGHRPRAERTDQRPGDQRSGATHEVGPSSECERSLKAVPLPSQRSSPPMASVEPLMSPAASFMPSTRVQPTKKNPIVLPIQDQTTGFLGGVPTGSFGVRLRCYGSIGPPLVCGE